MGCSKSAATTSMRSPNQGGGRLKWKAKGLILSRPPDSRFMNDSVLPHLTAALSATSFVLLVAAFYKIRRGDVQTHRRLMLSALAVFGLFLVSYVVYHAQYGSVRFTGQGPGRAGYFIILVTHVVLPAALAPPV